MYLIVAKWFFDVAPPGDLNQRHLNTIAIAVAVLVALCSFNFL